MIVDTSMATFHLRLLFWLLFGSFWIDIPVPQCYNGTRSWSVGSVGRAHRSHRWGHWFESSTDHQKPPSQEGGFFRLSFSPSGPAGRACSQDGIIIASGLFPNCMRAFLCLPLLNFFYRRWLKHRLHIAKHLLRHLQCEDLGVPLTIPPHDALQANFPRNIQKM